MPGTRKGGLKASITNRERHGDDFYSRIGAKGGVKTGPKGFALNRELAREAGRIGGLKSRRGAAKKKGYPTYSELLEAQTARVSKPRKIEVQYEES